MPDIMDKHERLKVAVQKSGRLTDNSLDAHLDRVPIVHDVRDMLMMGDFQCRSFGTWSLSEKRQPDWLKK